MQYIGQRKLTVCLDCHDTAANSQGQGIHVLRYRPQTVQAWVSLGPRSIASDVIVRPRVSYIVASCAFISIFVLYDRKTYRAMARQARPRPTALQLHDQ